jgi:hypothetical protein
LSINSLENEKGDPSLLFKSDMELELSTDSFIYDINSRGWAIEGWVFDFLIFTELFTNVRPLPLWGTQCHVDNIN